jgi:NAD(P)-dependent dehydrogenase (short-subunit alcohol dehydrogenase family)
VIVTGGGGNIGRGVCRALTKAGATVAVLDLDPSGADGAALRITCDITDANACESAVAQVVAELGGIDALVNIAQVFRLGMATIDATDEDLRISFESGPIASFRLMRLCYPHLITRGGGSVVNFGSGVGTGGNPRYLPYAAAKEAIRGITRVAANEWGPSNIRVNAICPVAAQDPANAPWVSDQVLATIPLGRIGDPEADIGAAVVYLVGPGSYITGQTLMVDGGAGRYR